MDNKAMRNDIAKEAKGTVNNINGGVKEAREFAEKAGEQAKQEGKRLLGDAKEFIGSHTPEYVREGLVTAQAQAKRAFEASEKAMRKNVWYSVLGAAGIGLALGAWMCRRRD